MKLYKKGGTWPDTMPECFEIPENATLGNKAYSNPLIAFAKGAFPDSNNSQLEYKIQMNQMRSKIKPAEKELYNLWKTNPLSRYTINKFANSKGLTQMYKRLAPLVQNGKSTIFREENKIAEMLLVASAVLSRDVAIYKITNAKQLALRPGLPMIVKRVAGCSNELSNKKLPVLMVLKGGDEYTVIKYTKTSTCSLFPGTKAFVCLGQDDLTNAQISNYESKVIKDIDITKPGGSRMHSLEKKKIPVTIFSRDGSNGYRYLVQQPNDTVVSVLCSHVHPVAEEGEWTRRQNYFTDKIGTLYDSSGDNTYKPSSTELIRLSKSHWIANLSRQLREDRDGVLDVRPFLSAFDALSLANQKLPANTRVNRIRHENNLDNWVDSAKKDVIEYERRALIFAATIYNKPVALYEKKPDDAKLNGVVSYTPPGYEQRNNRNNMGTINSTVLKIVRTRASKTEKCLYRVILSDNCDKSATPMAVNDRAWMMIGKIREARGNVTGNFSSLKTPVSITKKIHGGYKVLQPGKPNGNTDVVLPCEYIQPATEGDDWQAKWDYMAKATNINLKMSMSNNNIKRINTNNASFIAFQKSVGNKKKQQSPKKTPPKNNNNNNNNSNNSPLKEKKNPSYVRNVLRNILPRPKHLNREPSEWHPNIQSSNSNSNSNYTSPRANNSPPRAPANAPANVPARPTANTPTPAPRRGRVVRVGQQNVTKNMLIENALRKDPRLKVFSRDAIYKSLMKLSPTL